MLHVCSSVKIIGKVVSTMGMKFRKSIKLGGGTKLNLSKSGVGISTGVKGFRVSKNTSGRSRVTASLPGTGLSYTKEYGSSGSSGNSQSAPTHHSHSHSYIGGGSAPSGGGPEKKDKPPFFQRTGIIILLLIFFAPVGIYLLWRYMPNMKKGVKALLSVLFGLVFISVLVPSSGGTADDAAQPPAIQQQAETPETQSETKTQKPAFAVDEPKPAQEPQEAAEPKTEATTQPDAQTAQEPAQTPQETQQTTAQSGEPKQEQPVQREEFKDEERVVYITPTGEKYHKKGCRTIKGDCTEISINDAIARGYTACGVCGG